LKIYKKFKSAFSHIPHFEEAASPTGDLDVSAGDAVSPTGDLLESPNFAICGTTLSSDNSTRLSIELLE